MSIEFRPDMRTVVNDDTVYEFGHEKIYEDSDGSLGKILSEKYDNDMGYHFYKYVESNGPQPLSYWMSVFNDFGEVTMDSGGEYPLFWVRKDGMPVMELSLVARSKVDDAVVQMSNMNASNILQLLGLGGGGGSSELGFDLDEMVGSISPIALLRKIESVKGSRILDEFTRPDVDRGNLHSRGIDINYINGKLLQLEALADFCIKQECDVKWG
jgi:hypothetical protein